MKSKKKMQTPKIQTKKIQTRKMSKINKNLRTRKKHIYSGGAPGFSEQLINRLLLVIEGLIIKSIDQLGNVIGIDVSDPKQVNAKLDEIKVIISDPEIHEKVVSIVEKINMLLYVALEAAQPYVKPMADKINNIYIKSTSDLGSSTITILKNIAKAIPVYGAIVALIDTANTVTVTAANTVTAKQHAQSAYNEAVILMTDDFKNLLKQKQGLLSRIPTNVPGLPPPTQPQT
jgi:hypothetical protein